MADYLIRLPWPPKEAMPNYKRSHHWRKYSKPCKTYRETCWSLTLEVTGASPSGLPKPLPVKIEFYPPDRRGRDDDNVIGAFKHGRDGVSDALGMDDKHFAAEHSFHDPVKGGCVLVHIRNSKGERGL